MASFYRIKPSFGEYDHLILIEESKPSTLNILSFLRGSNSLEECQSFGIINVAIEKVKEKTDFPGFVGFEIVFSERAKNILLPLINDNIELLYLKCISGETYYLVRIIKVIDCIDYSQSVIEKYKNGEFRKFNSHKFREAEIGDNHFFRIPERHIPIVSQKFKDVVEQNELKGLIFQDNLMW